MLSVNQFFASFQGHEEYKDVQLVGEFLVNAGAEFCIDPEHTEMDEFIIQGLTDRFYGYNWELVFSSNGYEVYGVATLNCWRFHWKDDQVNGVPVTWFVG